MAISLTCARCRDWVQPSPDTAISGTTTDHSEHDEHAHHHVHHSDNAPEVGEVSSQDDLMQDYLSQIDTVAATSREAGMDGIIEIAVPAEDGAAWTVTEMRESWKLANDAISVDGQTGEVVDRVDHADWPLAAKLSAWLIQLHMGTLFGWINQLVLGAIALGLLAIITWDIACGGCAGATAAQAVCKQQGSGAVPVPQY